MFRHIFFLWINAFCNSLQYSMNVLYNVILLPFNICILQTGKIKVTDRQSVCVLWCTYFSVCVKCQMKKRRSANPGKNGEMRSTIIILFCCKRWRWFQTSVFLLFSWHLARYPKMCVLCVRVKAVFLFLFLYLVCIFICTVPKCQKNWIVPGSKFDIRDIGSPPFPLSWRKCQCQFL